LIPTILDGFQAGKGDTLLIMCSGYEFMVEKERNTPIYSAQRHGKTLASLFSKILLNMFLNIMKTTIIGIVFTICTIQFGQNRKRGRGQE
jgi:hypothetical protein